MQDRRQLPARRAYGFGARTQIAAYLVGAAYNLLRIARLLPEPVPG